MLGLTCNSVSEVSRLLLLNYDDDYDDCYYNTMVYYYPTALSNVCAHTNAVHSNVQITSANMCTAALYATHLPRFVFVEIHMFTEFTMDTVG